MLFGKKPACDWLIVGLGNPGREYERSRHNMGFRALDLLAGTLGVSVKKAKFRALTAQASYRGQKLLLMKPETFMNASGMAVEQAVQYYKLPAERVLVLFDDISLTPGRIRVASVRLGRAGITASSRSSPTCIPTSSRGSRSAWAKSRRRSTIWRIGCWGRSRRRSRRSLIRRCSTLPRRRCASWSPAAEGGGGV